MADCSAMVKLLVVIAVFLCHHHGLQFFGPAIASAKCSTSIQGAMLQNQAYRSLISKSIQECYHLCRREDLCQSLNFYKDHNNCELNNRTASKSNPLKIVNEEVFFFENPFRVQPGLSEDVPAISCQEIKEASTAAVSGRYWLLDEHSVSRNVINAYCNMTLGVREDCTGTPCLNGGTCSYQGGGQYTCLCRPSYEGVHCEVKMPSCHAYKNLSTADRNEQFALKDPKNPMCDCNSSLISGWHRFTGDAGTRMPTRCVATHRCNTHAPGWLSGSLPSLDEGIVKRTVCFNWNSNCCRWTASISVNNCGDFYVYDLVKTPTWHLRYCGTN